MKLSKKGKRIVFLVAIAIVAIGIGIFISYLRQVNEYRTKVASIQFSDIDITSIADGTYFGESDVGFISAKVEVTIIDGVMTDIKLTHHHDRGITAERTVDEMLERQTTAVDAVSGATNSSRVIRQAVENALLGK
jgi:uncharacterized protein with FMN-binding domain